MAPLSLRRFRRRLRQLPAQLRDLVNSETVDETYRPGSYSGLPAEEVLPQVIRQFRRFAPSLAGEEMLAALERIHPGDQQRLLAEADAVCRHRIRLFGSVHDLGDQINWRRDPQSGYDWPATYSGRIDPWRVAGRADIRPVWELSCLRQTVVLGQAYWVSSDEQWAQEFVRQVRHWVRENPVNTGPAWSCAMITGIRAANLVWAAALLAQSPALDEPFQRFFLNLLRAHGRHIHAHLENTAPVRGNHYLANLVGLVCVSCACPLISEAAGWLRFALRELAAEVALQVGADGANFEASVPYHRLVTEMLLHAVILPRRAGLAVADAAPGDEAGATSNGETAAGELLATLERMCEFTLHYTRPDGRAPQIGDNDSSRFVAFGATAADEDDHRHLLAVAGELFDRDDFRQFGAPSRDEALWMLGADLRSPGRPAASPNSRLFANTGVCILRAADEYAAVRCGSLGTGGRGTHTHNDNLSFELCAGGQAYIVDPGTFTYLRNPELRDLFRSTSFHNTLRIDGREQHDPVPGDAFRLRAASTARILRWTSDLVRDVLIARVEWAGDAAGAIAHQREFCFHKADRCWTITDEVTGTGVRTLEWRFHLDPAVGGEIAGESVVLRAPAGPGLRLSGSLIAGGQPAIRDGWYSPGYDRRVRSEVLCLSRQVPLPFRRTLQIDRLPAAPEPVACDAAAGRPQATRAGRE